MQMLYGVMAGLLICLATAFTVTYCLTRLNLIRDFNLDLKAQLHEKEVNDRLGDLERAVKMMDLLIQQKITTTIDEASPAGDTLQGTSPDALERS